MSVYLIIICVRMPLASDQKYRMFAIHLEHRHQLDNLSGGGSQLHLTDEHIMLTLWEIFENYMLRFQNVHCGFVHTKLVLN